MLETLRQGLIITGIGMGLVFLMIFALWGIMALLVFLTNPREKKVDKTEEITALEPEQTILELAPTSIDDEDELKRLAAAMAVAFAIKRPRPQSMAPISQPEQSSSWLGVGRAQQLLSRNRGRN